MGHILAYNDKWLAEKFQAQEHLTCSIATCPHHVHFNPSAHPP